MSASVKTITAMDADALADLFNEEKLNILKKELQDFQKCVKGNLKRINALCDIRMVSGHTLDASVCAPVSSEKLEEIGYEFVHLLLAGMPFNGKTNGWSVGFMGSRWADMDAKKHGVDHIRCAFYSKKHYKGEKWSAEEPYIIQITVEKERR